jgi:hypothetical protein
MVDTIPNNGMASARDFELQSLTIINSSGSEVKLDPQLVEIEWHQGIEENTMFGSLVLADAQDILNSFFITGNEKLQIKIDQPSLGYPLDREFRITKVTNRTNNGNAGTKYVMHFVSGEAINENAKIVSKAYKGARYSDIARDILQNYIKPKKINRIDQTSGAFDIVIPGFRPLEALHWLASRSFNGTDSSNFFFFENREGFEFVSMKTLFAQKPLKNMVYDIKSVNETPNSPSDVQKNRNSIEKMEVINDFDVIKTGDHGGYASSLTTVNLFNREIKQFVYSLTDLQGKLLNQHIPTNDRTLLVAHSANYKTHIFVGDTKTEKENSVDKWLMPRQMHNAVIRNFMLRAEAPLDISVKAGDIIHIDMPKFVAAGDKGKELDDFRTGKYLVHSVSHVFKQVDERQIGTTILILASDSVSRSLPTEQVAKT